jgi:mono/diheme cytochrome c family protein
MRSAKACVAARRPQSSGAAPDAARARSRLRFQTSVRALLLGAAVLTFSACRGGRPNAEEIVVAGGDPHRGVSEIQTYGCGVCHVIPRVRGADGVVGPPLTSWAERAYIGGELPNVPRNLVSWIMNAPSIEPNVAMPNLGVSEAQAKDIAAYLYTLR